jgi:hypothetical protein
MRSEVNSFHNSHWSILTIVVALHFNKDLASVFESEPNCIIHASESFHWNPGLLSFLKELILSYWWMYFIMFLRSHGFRMTELCDIDTKSVIIDGGGECLKRKT